MASFEDQEDTIFIKLGGRSGLQRDLEFLKVLSALGPDRLVAGRGLSPAHISPANPHGFIPAQRKPNWPKPTGRLPPLPQASMLPNGVAERTSRSVTHPGTTPTRAHLTTKFSPLPSPLEWSIQVVMGVERTW
ncbi:hypothetical protein ACLOJK_014745 [Asimina triloba]